MGVLNGGGNVHYLIPGPNLVQLSGLPLCNQALVVAAPSSAVPAFRTNAVQSIVGF